MINMKATYYRCQLCILTVNQFMKYATKRVMKNEIDMSKYAITCTEV